MRLRVVYLTGHKRPHPFWAGLGDAHMWPPPPLNLPGGLCSSRHETEVLGGPLLESGDKKAHLWPHISVTFPREAQCGL